MHTGTGSRCQQLTRKERYHIMALLQAGKSQTEIAARIKRSRSVISREIQRNSSAGRYDPAGAQSSAC